MTSFDYLTLDDDIEQIRRVTTGDLQKEAVDQLDSRRQQITDAQAIGEHRGGGRRRHPGRRRRRHGAAGHPVDAEEHRQRAGTGRALPDPRSSWRRRTAAGCSPASRGRGQPAMADTPEGRTPDDRPRPTPRPRPGAAPRPSPRPRVAGSRREREEAETPARSGTAGRGRPRPVDARREGRGRPRRDRAAGRGPRATPAAAAAPRRGIRAGLVARPAVRARRGRRRAAAVAAAEPRLRRLVDLRRGAQRGRRRSTPTTTRTPTGSVKRKLDVAHRRPARPVREGPRPGRDHRHLRAGVGDHQLRGPRRRSAAGQRRRRTPRRSWCSGSTSSSR